MADNNKDTIYIDIDDEITSIIDKVRGSSGQIVALVLPKRATTLQSIVNMKLLKRSAEETKKNIVLVTTETGILPLAGAVGLHVAKTPTSRPEIPVAPNAALASDEVVDESIDLDDGAPIAADSTVGALAGSSMPLSAGKPDNGIETVELDNEDKTVAPVAAAATRLPKSKKDKKLHVPNFDRFRLILIFGGLLLLILIVGGYVALAVLPKAVIAVKTNASNVNTNVDFSLSTTADTFSGKTVPAKQVQSQKTLTGTATASGQKNNGDKAHGQVTLSSACANGIQTIPQGTGVSSGGQTFITQRDVSLMNASGNQKNCTLSGTTEITAQNPGAKYNVSGGSSFTVSSSSSGSYTASTVSGTGSTAGGTDDIQTVVSQADIDSAKSKISGDQANVQDDLKAQLQGQGLYAITATYNTGTPATTSSSQAGDSASSVTVTQTITYSMLGAKQADLQSLVDADIKDQIDTSQQSILSRGIEQTAFKLKNSTSGGAAMNIQTTAEVGPLIDVTKVADQAAGKKSGEITADLKANPDVTDVEVKLSPFWVTKAPKKVSKITVTIAKPTTSANAR